MLTPVSDSFDSAHRQNWGYSLALIMQIKTVESQNNRQLAEIFHRMANCYRYLGPKHRFRAIAYDAAGRSVNGLRDDITHYAGSIKTLDKISGIGESIAEKVIEFLNNGKIETYEKLKRQVPEELIGLMDITGFGPATVKLLHKKFRIHSKDELIAALESDKLKKVKGFGPKKIENIKHGLKLYKAGQERMLLSEALNRGRGLLREISGLPGVTKAELAGSVRRRKETIGDLDIVACAAREDWKKIMNSITRLPQVEKLIAKGETKLSFLMQHNSKQVDVRLVGLQEYGAALFYFTGSKEFNIKLRTWARNRGWKLSEYGLFDIKSGNQLAGATEEEIFEFLDMQYVPPELREGSDVIETARAFKLPALVELKDIKGDMQMHSRWSDGAEKIETIARHILKEFPRYEYIVITDHSPSERVARGLQVEDFEKQFIEIENVNKKLGKLFVRKGVEVDILQDGSLDLPDELLEKFDWVTASIHTGFTHENTERLISACHHPHVHCIGHPAGRLIGKRDGYPVAWERLFDCLVATSTAIEINAQPDRLDLQDQLVKEAIAQGVTITISTDAHMLTQFDFMELGTAVARRGWCTKADVLNTHSWEAIEKFKKKKGKLTNAVVH